MNIEVKEKVHEASGLTVRTTGEVYIPETPHHKAHWTFGCTNKQGYKVLQYKGKQYKVHRLVAETFLDRVEGKDFVDHINRDKTDNRLENLRWVSCTENNLNRSQSDVENLVFGVHKDDPLYSTLNQRKVRQKKYAAGYKSARMPDGSRKWVKKEDSLRLVV